MSADARPERDRITLAGWCLTAGIIIVTSAIAVVLAARPVDLGRAAGVFPPWWSQAMIIESASQAGTVLAIGTLPFVVVVQASGSDVVDRLRRAGALIALDARYARLCGGQES